MMEEKLNIPQKSIKDFTNNSTFKKWKCEKCKMVFNYPQNQTTNLHCCFCKNDLVKCSPNDPLLKVTDENEKTEDKTYVVIKRDKEDKIVDIIQVDEEKYNLINSNKDISSPSDVSIQTTELNVSELSPFNSIGVPDEKMFSIAVYKQNEFCAITNILKGIFNKALKAVKDDEDIDETIFNVVYSVKDKDSYIDKDNKNYPQIVVFYGKDKFIEFIPIKDLNEGSLYHKLFYYFTLVKNGLI